MPNTNHAVGALNELEIGYQLANNGSYPISFRAEIANAAAYVEQLRNQVGDEKYLEIKYAAPKLVEKLMLRVQADGLMANTTDVFNVTWTSVPDTDLSSGDHEKLTGIKDVNSDGDIGFQTSKGFVFVSAKYGTHMTLRNPGVSTLEKMFDVDITFEMKVYIDCLNGAGFDMTKSWKQLHDEYKLMKGTERGRAAEDCALTMKHFTAHKIWESCREFSSEHLRYIIADLAAPETVHPHYRTATKPNEITIDKSRESVEKSLEEYENFTVGDTKKHTTFVNFYGTRKYDGKREVVGRLGIKFRSGPFSTIGGNFSMPALTRKKKKREATYLDVDDTLYKSDPVNGARADLMGPEGFIRKLSAHEYSTYQFKEGEYTSHSEFEDADLFFQTCVPIARMADKARKLMAKGKKVEILTARNYFRDMDKFHQALAAYGLDCNCHMAGSRSEHRNSPARKKAVILDEIAKWGYNKITLYDDSIDNLKAFLSIKDIHPDIELIAWQVEHNPKKDKTVIRKIK